MSKIKLFLGGYINYTNAQNLNCRAIAEYLDKNQFEVLALTIHFGKRECFEVNTFYCFMPFSLSIHLGFLWGIINCDVAYLPKHVDTPLWVLRLAKWLNKPLFTTIEGNVTDFSKPNLTALFGSQKKMQKHFGFFNKIFGITQQLIQETKLVLRIEDNPLLLGVDGGYFARNKVKNLKSIVFIGGLIKRKRIDEFLLLAKLFPDLHFKVVGGGPERGKLERNSSLNVTFFGVLDHKEMNKVFASSDLMFLPAKSEGFPKVILEAASAGIPSVVYNTYGASDWMEHKINGFIVNDFEEVNCVVDELLNNSDLLKTTSENAVKLANNFDWKNVIMEWEKVVINLYNGK